MAIRVEKGNPEDWVIFGHEWDECLGYITREAGTNKTPYWFSPTEDSCFSLEQLREIVKFIEEQEIEKEPQ